MDDEIIFTKILLKYVFNIEYGYSIDDIIKEVEKYMKNHYDFSLKDFI